MTGDERVRQPGAARGVATSDQFLGGGLQYENHCTKWRFGESRPQSITLVLSGSWAIIDGRKTKGRGRPLCGFRVSFRGSHETSLEMSFELSFQRSFEASFRRSSELSDVRSDALSFEPSYALSG